MRLIDAEALEEELLVLMRGRLMQKSVEAAGIADATQIIRTQPTMVISAKRVTREEPGDAEVLLEEITGVPDLSMYAYPVTRKIIQKAREVGLPDFSKALIEEWGK